MSANTGTKAAARRVVAITGGWVVAACAEAAAYLVLGRAIMSGASVAAVLAAAALSLLATTVVARAGYHAGVRLGGELYKAMGLALQRAKPAWFTAQNRTLAVTTAGRGIPSLMSVPAHELQTYVVAVTVPVMLCAGVAILVDGATAAVCALAVIVALVAQVVAQRALAAADGKRAAAARASDAAAMELVDHAELLRTASGTSGAVNRIERRWRMEESALRRTNAAAAPATALTVLASALPMILVAWYLVSRQEPAWTVLAVVVLAARATGPLESLAVAGIGARSIVSTVSDVRAISGAPVLALPTAPGVPNGSAIEFDKVSTPQISTEVSARIDDGAVVALVGPSGSGKTTLLGLIARFDDPDRGAVTLGGVPLPDLAAGDIASAISFVPQEPIVFTGTVADNVRVGNPAASDGDVRAALASAGLDSLVATAPDGIDMPVGHRGESLSGGERQRLEIARALVKRAPVLLLDEPTSALDPETERIVIDGVRATGATVFVVTHRGAEQWRPDVTIELRG